MSEMDLSLSSLQLPDAAEPATHTLALAIVGLARRLHLRSNRRALAGLSDRQLRDAGIDLSLAGRGKAAAASAATLRRLQSLAHG